MVNRKNLAAATNCALALQSIDGELTGEVSRFIPATMTCTAWCEFISNDRLDPDTGRVLRALRIDGKPFSLADRPAMRAIYDRVPCSKEEAAGNSLILMKCAQVGFTVMEILAALYMALKFEPLRVGFFLPSVELARSKSRERFLPIVRSIPEAFDLLTAPKPGELNPRRSEGSVTQRWMGGSVFHFLWTSGRATTESKPMDAVCFDEVQEMTISAMEKVLERLSASTLKFVLMGSTANHPGSDIHYWYQKGSQHRFHTRCPECGAEEPLDEYFPACIGFDQTTINPRTGAPGAYRYRCRSGHWIDNPQDGAWVATNTEADPHYVSFHFTQMLSPTISPEELYLAYLNSHDIANFYNRKLGKPFQDPNELPVTDAALAACVAEGEKIGHAWRKSGKNTFMGIDQMAEFNCVVIMERLDDGRHAVIHVEEVYGERPFDRCSELIERYGVRVCVVEQLPNVNDARRFARQHDGRAFLVTQYCQIDDGIARWGDARLTRSEFRTVEDQRDRHIVHVDQHKAMSLTLHRIAAAGTLFPDPQGLVQEVRERGGSFQAAVLKDRVFPHLKSTALVTKRINERELRFRRAVEKRGKDPHFAFAFMLAEVAMVRADSTAAIWLPPHNDPAAPTHPEQHPIVQAIAQARVQGTCGACANFVPSATDRAALGKGGCALLHLGGELLRVHASDPASHVCGYVGRE
jgi:hypothetical protein